MQDKTIHARPQAGKEIHRPFVRWALGFGVLGGFPLAVSLPLEGIADSIEVSWVAHAQVHGHLQVVGFAALFVVGMALRLAPRFGGRSEPALPALVPLTLWLLVGGMLGRALGQPLAEHTPFAWLLGAGALAEAGGAACFAALMCATLRPAIRAGQPHAILLAAGALGLLVQAALGAWWLLDIAAEGRTVLAAAHTRALLHLQFFGALLPAILGVGLRSFPTIFGAPAAPRRAGLVVAALWAVGIALWGGADVWATERSVEWGWPVAGQAITGAAILGAIALFRPWRRELRLAAASSGLRWALQPAVLWLGVTGALLVGTAAQSAAAAQPTATSTLDAVRHLFAAGTVTLAIVCMAQLMLPEFASERLVGTPAAWRGAAFGAMLSAAAVLRGLLPLWGLDGDARWWAMAAAGLLGWVALAACWVLLRRAQASHLLYLERLRQMRTADFPIVERPSIE